MDNIASFSETMFLLLGGTGVGYSVQRHHVAQLPAITKPGKKRTLIRRFYYGWADAVKVLMRSYLEGKFLPTFDFRAVRHKVHDWLQLEVKLWTRTIKDLFSSHPSNS
jgi:ribonucleoside-diphosphate reductase alpha chain